MKKVVVILLIATTIPVVWFAYVLATDVFMVGYEWRNERAWNKVKNDVFISEIGHWRGENFQKELDLKKLWTDPEISYNDWSKLLENNHFFISEKDGVCGWAAAYTYYMPFLAEYETCGVRIVGSSSCTYAYIIAANFSENTLQDVVGTYSHHICL